MNIDTKKFRKEIKNLSNEDVGKLIHLLLGKDPAELGDCKYLVRRAERLNKAVEKRSLAAKSSLNAKHSSSSSSNSEQSTLIKSGNGPQTIFNINAEKSSSSSLISEHSSSLKSDSDHKSNSNLNTKHSSLSSSDAEYYEENDEAPMDDFGSPEIVEIPLSLKTEAMKQVYLELKLLPTIDASLIEDMTLKIDVTMKSKSPDDWRGNPTKEKAVMKNLLDILLSKENVHRVFQVIKKQGEY